VFIVYDVQLDVSYRDCCEDRDSARQELDQLKNSLQTLEDSKLHCDQQITSLSMEVQLFSLYFILYLCCGHITDTTELKLYTVRVHVMPCDWSYISSGTEV